RAGLVRGRRDRPVRDRVRSALRARPLPNERLLQHRHRRAIRRVDDGAGQSRRIPKVLLLALRGLASVALASPFAPARSRSLPALTLDNAFNDRLVPYTRFNRTALE